MDNQDKTLNTSPDSIRSNVKLKFSTKLSFAMGDIYAGGFFNIINFFYAIFLTDVVRISPVWAGVIFTVSKIWDAITDPLMGAISDRTKSRFGRRRPYFLMGIPLIFLSFAMMWYPLSSGSEISKVIFYGFAYMLSNTVATFVQVPFLSMAAEISTDYNERNSISGIRMFVSGASSLVCAVAPMLIVSMYQDVATGHFVMGIIFGLIFALPWLLVFRVKEPPIFASTAAEEAKKTGMFKLMVNTLKVKSFRRLLYMYLGIFVTMDLLAMMEAYFLTYIVKAPEILSYILGILLLFEVVTMPLATFITNKTSKVKVIIWGSTAWALLCLANLFITPATPHIVLYAISASIGVAIAFPIVGIISLFGDVTDVGELYYGTRNEGSFFGVQQFTRKCASAVANGVTLGVIGIAGFINPVEEIRNGVTVLITQVQPDIVLALIRGFMSFTGVLLIPTVVFAILWQLTPERHARMIEYLDKKRAGLPVDQEIATEMQYLREKVL